MTGDADAVHAGIIEAQRKQIKDLKRSIGYARKRAELAEEKAEADLFHAAYVGMCATHPNRALTIGQSQQEH